MLRYTIITALTITISAGSLMAQAEKKVPDAKKPAAVKAIEAVKPAPAKPADTLKITVVSVSGIVEQHSATEEKAKWTAIKAGDVLTEMTLIRTGLGGYVVLKFSDRGLVTVKSGTKIGIASFRKQGNVVKTSLGLKYGAIRAKVDSTHGYNDFRVRTAIGTLAARGTGGDMAQWGDFSFQAKGTDGAWNVAVSNRKVSLIAGQWTNKELTLPATQLLQRHGIQMGDPHGGLSGNELKNLLQNGSGRGIIGFVGNAAGTGTPKLILPNPTPQTPDSGSGSGSDDPI